MRGLRAEQLLTSDFFGLSSTADPELEKALAQKADQAQRSATQSTVLSSATPVVPTSLLGDTPQEQIAAEAMDAFLQSRDGGSSLERQSARRSAVEALKAVLEAGPKDSSA